jgi:RNA polymerase sigma-70 factor (ECF subfamily)
VSTKNRFIESLFRRHFSELLAFARRRSGETAEDVVQDVYLKLLLHRAPEMIENPRAFLYQATSNLTVDQHRWQSVRSRLHCGDSSGEGEIDNVVGSGGTPEDQALVYQEFEQLSAILRELPDIARHAFVLHRLEGYSHQEISQRLGISVRTSERHVNQAALHVLERMGPLNAD